MDFPIRKYKFICENILSSLIKMRITPETNDIIFNLKLKREVFP